jgi:hypothetical protein
MYFIGHAFEPFEPAGDELWKIAWLFYEQPAATVPVVAYNQPVLIKAHPAGFAVPAEMPAKLIGEE